MIGGSIRAVVAAAAVELVPAERVAAERAERAVGIARCVKAAFVCSGELAMTVQEERKEGQRLYFEAKSTDAKRDLPVEELLLCMTIHQSAEEGLYIPVVLRCTALILASGVAARRSRSVGAVADFERLAR
jgi:hypothetical protein